MDVLRDFFAVLCFVGFAFQCYDQVIKFFEGYTVSSSRIQHPRKTKLLLPTFTICPQPFDKKDELEKRGLRKDLWNLFMITWELKVPAEWPSDEAVYNETTYGFEEIMEAVETSVMLPNGTVRHTTCLPGDLSSPSDRCPFAVTHHVTRFNGRCFSVKSMHPVGSDFADGISVKLRDFWAGTGAKGGYDVYIHEDGYERLIIQQNWLGLNPKMLRVQQESLYDIALTKSMIRRRPERKADGTASCSMISPSEYMACLDAKIAELTKDHTCRIPQMMLKTNATRNLPLCTRMEDVHKLLGLENGAMMTSGCSPPCHREAFAMESRDFGGLYTDKGVVLFLLYSTTDVSVVEEYVVMDFNAILSSLGGSLGLFLGFSFLDGFTLVRSAVTKLLRKSKEI